MIGVNLQLFDGTTQKTSLSAIQAMWWDITEPKDGYRPIGKSSAVTTDSSGYINLDLSNVTGLTIGDYGFLMLYKLDATDHKDSLVFSGKVQTSNITSGVDMYYYDSGWTRPTDWPALDAIADGVQKVQGVYAVYDIETAGNAVAITVAGAYHVDWGDGTNADFATGVSAEHTYDYADTDLGAVTTRGYKCAVITITPQSGQNLTSVNFQDRHSTFTQICDAPWLDIAINGEYISTLTISLATRVVRTQKLEQVVLGQKAATLTNMSSMFSNCSSLQSIPLLNTGAVTNMSYMFNNCYSLQYAALYNTRISFTVANCNLGPEALNAIYTNLGTGLTGKVITVTGNWGTASDNPALVPAGWSVTG